MQFTATFYLLLSLAFGTNAASVASRQDPAASIDAYGTEGCTGLPNFPIQIQSSSVGECGSYTGSLSNLKLTSLGDPACTRE